ncbi:murein hydrolase activator EnvC family protein [Tenggerimyces flavus]|uniref:Murein hydrolase activator EnvC family protein n=1 Tax=Tenggerimyces flavus TaxID=1708749 RepID=A0ABV7YI27_9ACTN|nr:M23 family metallopeptidase [Tenggerimyces flavus]MBM7786798.1 murein DD-endopeptidase MepM/ murein hydrolase activator NlpD [Tenggerimyces flavus]
MTNPSTRLALVVLALLGWWCLCTGPASAGATAWQWPLSPRPEVLRGFHPPPVPWGAGHRGVDLAASAGQTVRSAGAGQVSYAGVLAGRGVVVVRHGELRSTYEPVASSVTVGTRVAAGAALGTVEAAGHCTGRTCLHWGLKRGAEYLDPLALVGLGPPRLLPLDSSSVSAASSPSPSVAAPAGPQRAGVAALADALGPFAAPAAGAVAGAVVAGVMLRRALPPTGGSPPPPPRTPAAPGAVINLDEVRRRLRRSA